MEAQKVKWARRDDIFDMFGIPVRKFQRLVHEGYVRSVKFGDTQQAARVYRVADVEDALQALAEGRQPRRPTGNRR